MAREIKFRAWNKNLRKYIDINNVAVDPINGDVIDLGGYELLEVNHEAILEQYTGLKDKIGIEIYEGDIVQINGDYDYIGFEDYEFCTMIKHEPLADYVYDTAKGEPKFQDDIFHVVGSIHENPELLEE